jgi:hypothetical protein
VDQRFEDDVMQDLSGQGPAASGDEAAFEAMAAAATDGFGEGTLEDGSDEHPDPAADFAGDDGFDEDSGDDRDLGFDAAEDEMAEGLEASIADALSTQGADEFLARILGGVARLAPRAARETPRRPVRGRRADRPAPRGSGSDRIRARQPLTGLLRRLGQHLAEGGEVREAFADLAELFAEEGLDEALPVLGGLTARALLEPLSAGRGTAPVRRQLVASATQAARTLVGRGGPEALRALPRLADSMARTALRRGLRPAALPQALRRTVAQVASQPALLARLARPGRRHSPIRPGRGAAQRLVVPGPVEIRILSRFAHPMN